jgi:outer membrane lipoprotein SlyB
MKRLQMTVTASTLTLLLSTAAFGGTITGSRTNSVGTITGSRAGTITGSKAGTITGSRAGTITGSRAGTITGSRAGVVFDDSETVIAKVMMLMLNLAW